MGDSLDDILDGALDDFEELTSSTDTASTREHPHGTPSGTPALPPVATPEITPDVPSTEVKKAPAFDPLKKQQKTKRKGSASATGARSTVGSIPAASAAPPTKLPPELEQLAADLAKLISETQPEDNTVPGSASASTHAQREPGHGPMASTTASLQALDELRQQAVASQGALPTAAAAAAAAGQQGGGLFGGLLPDMDNLKDPGMNVIVDSIMQHLLSKEVLQQPMREIRDCYPPWLERNQGKVAPDDLERYTKQYGFIQQICQLYEEHPDNYSDLVALMQQMQACGDPPEDIVKEMSAGLEHTPPGASEGEGEDDVPIDLQQLQQEINKCPVQ